MNYRQTRRALTRCQWFQLRMRVRTYSLFCVGLRARILDEWEAEFS